MGLQSCRLYLLQHFCNTKVHIFIQLIIITEAASNASPLNLPHPVGKHQQTSTTISLPSSSPSTCTPSHTFQKHHYFYFIDIIHLERWQKSKATSQNNTLQKQQMKEQQDSPTSSYLLCCVTFPFPKQLRTPNYQLSLGITWGCLPVLLPAWIKKIASRRIKFRAFSQ